MDGIYIAGVLALFALSALLVRACEKLRGLS